MLTVITEMHYIVVTYVVLIMNISKVIKYGNEHNRKIGKYFYYYRTCQLLLRLHNHNRLKPVKTIKYEHRLQYPKA